MLALIATGSGEYAREMLRKPYVIGRWMYSNGVRVPYVRASTRRVIWRIPTGCGIGDRIHFQLLARRSHLPWRVRLLPHAGRLSPATPTTLRTRPRQHRQLHHHAARVQSRLTVPALYAADGRHQAGYRRSDRLPQLPGQPAAKVIYFLNSTRWVPQVPFLGPGKL